jgi:hypothetical protein
MDRAAHGKAFHQREGGRKPEVVAAVVIQRAQVGWADLAW